MAAVDYPKLRSLTARDLVPALTRDGFTLDGQAGSHRHYYHSDGRRVTVTFHRSGETFKPKTLRAMIELQARWTGDDLWRLNLID